jgi:hypothetical protein
MIYDMSHIFPRRRASISDVDQENSVNEMIYDMSHIRLCRRASPFDVEITNQPTETFYRIGYIYGLVARGGGQIH